MIMSVQPFGSRIRTRWMRGFMGLGDSPAADGCANSFLPESLMNALIHQSTEHRSAPMDARINWH
jgi:hypothetical protein